ncbi:MAG TPA: redoxin domain-containing protein [Candidatus Deferrimicrobiaceae bacterium]|nr:redoxin domain-containing protein [Candidatus Deferrimicrobiaceae bacterium]
MTADRPWLQPGDPAPAFALPAINREGTVSIEDYRGRTPLLLGLYRGLHCPFCRRQLVQLSTTQEKLKAAGVETLAVVNTPVERARLYFKHRPARVLLAADAEASVHRAFGVPAFIPVEDPTTARWPWRATMEQFRASLINPTGELPKPLNGFEANDTLNQMDRFELTDEDKRIFNAHGSQLVGHFLLDQRGIVRWADVEAGARMTDIGRFPSDEELLAAARALPS